MPRLAIAVLLCAACSDAPSLPIDGAAAIDAATAVDAAAVEDAASDARPMPPATCGGHTLAFSRTEAETTAALTALLADVRAHAAAAYFREAIDGTQRTAILTGLQASLAVAHDVDPRAAAMAWLAVAAPQHVTAAEWAIDPLQAPIDPAAIAIGDVMIGRVARIAIDGVPWPAAYPSRWVDGGGASLLIGKSAVGWTLATANLTPATALATRADAEALAACTPPTPGPETTLRATVYRGLEFSGCAPSGEYAYTPRPDDVATWSSDLGFGLGAIVDGRRRWHPFTAVELVIAPANYWPTIGAADCMCHDVAGFTLRVDVVTGELLRTAPAIDCVVC